MKKYLQLLSIIAALIISITTSKTFGQCSAPVINSFSPTTGFIGSTVTINGAYFDPIITNNQVFFGATQASILTSSFGVMTVQVPVGATTAPISVKNNCNLTAYSNISFNGIFCPTPVTASTYQNVAFELSGIAGAYNMTAQDMDGDGKPDVISQGLGSQITIAKNTSTPGNLSFVAYNFPAAGSNSVAIADFDGDGKRDVLTNGYVYRNLSTVGNPSLSTSIYVGNVGYQCAAGDVNGDGKIDAISVNNGTVYICLNTSSGPGNISFSAPNTSINIGTQATGLQMVDVDKDGKVDIIGTQGSSNRAFTLRNTTPTGSTTPTFEAVEYWSSNGTYPYRCQIADFDKDGKIDLTTCNYNSANTAVFRNTSVPGDISFANAFIMLSPGANYRIAVGDVNGDGYPDVVTKSLGTNVFSVYTNTSTAPGVISFATRIDYTSSSQAEVSGIVIGDLDGDFVPDIATSGISSNKIRFHRNTSSQPDVNPPTALCKSITVALNPAGTVTVTGNMIDNGSSDACGIASLKINGLASLTYGCADVGVHSVTLTVTDRGGNTATCTAQVTIAPAAIIVSGQSTVCQGQTILLTANLGNSYQWQKDGTDILGAVNQTYTATFTGNYTVTVINTGCSGTSAAVLATINNNPSVVVSPNGNTYLCSPSNSALLTASVSSIYQWKLGGTNISGATQQNYSVTTAGSYTVQVVDAFGCTASSNSVLVSVNPPEIDITGNGTSIADGDSTPSLGDNTDFGTISPTNSVVKTYTIHNTGLNNLEVSSININGANAASFTLGGISLPLSISSGSSTSFTVSFTGTTLQVYNAEVVVNNNDCDESVYNFNVLAQVVCQAPAFTNCPFTGYSQIYADANSCSTTFAYNLTTTGDPAPVVTYSFTGATISNGSGTGSGSTFNTGQTTVTVTATNSCGTTSCTFVITVIDNVLPVAVCKPLTVYLNAAGTASIQPADINNGSSDNCGPVTLSFNSGIVCGTAVENQNVTITAPPGSVITSIDFASYGTPNGTCGNFTTGSCNASNSKSVVAAYLIGHNSGTIPALNSIFGDPCGGTVKRLFIQARYGATSAQSNVFNCSNIGSNTVSLLVSDANGNVSSCNSIVTVVDNQAPSITCPAAVTVQCAASVPAVNKASVSSSDNCSAIVSFVSDVISNQTCVNKYTITRTYKATDPSGNVTTCTQIITVNDNTAPVITCPANITVNNTTGQCGANVTFSATATDNCSGTPAITYSVASGSYFSVGSTTVTATATDLCGNISTCNFTVTVVDNQAPTIVCPADISVNATSASGAVVTYTALVGTDNCLSTTLRTAGLTSGSTFPIGSTTVTHKVTDASGLTAQCSFTVTVTGLLPQIVCPSNITVNNTTGQCGANVNFAATETIGIPASTITYSQNSGTSFPIGTTTVTATATNSVGSSTCSFTVTVVDNQPPVITCPANITVNNTAGQCGAVVNYGVSNNITFSQDFLKGPTNATYCNAWTSFRNQLISGNTYNKLTIKGTFDPVGVSITDPTMIDQIATALRIGTNGTWNSGGRTWAVGNCGGAGALSASNGNVCNCDVNGYVVRPCINFPSYSNPNWGGANTQTCQSPSQTLTVVFQLAGGNSSGIVATDNCSGVTVTQTAGLASGASFPIGSTTNTFVATDAAGNTATCNFTVTIVDIQAPTIVCPANISVNATSAAGAVVTYTAPVGTDNCVSSTIRTVGLASGSTFPIGTTTVTHKVTDASGLTAQCSFTVTVTGLLPQIVCPSNIIVNNTTGQCGAIVSFAATETVGIPASTITYSQNPGTFYPVGITTVTATATNAVGSSTCTFTVTVNDTQAPTITCAANQTHTADAGVCNAAVTVISPSTHDNCAVLSVTNNHNGTSNASGSYPVGTTTVLWTVTDIHGNTNTCSQTITVTDNEAPIITCADNQTHTADAGLCTAMVTVVSPVTSDNCGVLSVTNNFTNSSNASGVYPRGTTSITWTVTDIHGNSSSCVQTITVTDDEAPVLNAPKAITLDCGASILPSNTGMATATDNCTAAGSIVISYSDNHTVPVCGGIITRTWSATDASNNQTTETQTITVTPAALPTMTALADITVACGGLPLATTISFSNGLTGGCLISGTSNASTFTATPSACGGMVTETWTATDVCGRNVETVSRTITVSPAALPTMTALANITVECGGLPLASTISFSNELTGGCLISGTSNASTFTATPSACGGMVTETWTATDVCGRNVETVSRTITVSPAALPTMTALADITVACGGLPLASTISFSNELTGGCLISGTSNASTFTATPSACGGTVTETWTATDVCGRTVATVSRTITVSPSAIPTMTALPPVTISVPCGTSAIPSTLPYSNGLSGGCLISGTSNPSTFTSVIGTCGGTLTEKWTATDACGRALAPVYRVVTVSQNLGEVEPFVMFSGVGAVSNTGMSTFIGQVGSNLGAVSGFDPSTILYNADAHTTQAKIDLLNLYIHLTNIPVTNATHAAAFGSNETLVAGVYTIPGAGSISGNLNLDGQGNANAIFILKTNGAFSPAAGSSITLLNGLRACNVFWIAEGAISIGTASTMKGSFISHVGAVSMGAGGDLEGRLIATVGAVSFGPGVANLPIGLSTIPVVCVNSCNSTILGSAAQFTLFTTAGAVSNTSTSGIIGNIGSNAGAVTGFGTSASTLVGSIYNADGVTAQAAADLATGYTTLVNMIATNTSANAAVFGGGEIITPGVYEIGGAGSMAGTLTLDAGGNANAQFVIKFGGAFSVGAQSKIILTNGASHCNVFWLAEGAISIGASSYMKGSFIAHNGANTMGANGNLEGSLFSTAGAIGFNTGVGYISYSLCTNPGYIEYTKANPGFIKKENAVLIDSKLSVFPNPTRGIINLVTSEASKINSIQIVDIMGKLVYSANCYMPTIDLSNKAAGVYFIKVRLNSKITTTKIVVEK